ncbi:MAG: hypothetical protein JJU30_13335 [Alkalimonas sp.]|nr:hypothetical protein [Alkalimonas sp.]
MANLYLAVLPYRDEELPMRLSIEVTPAQHQRLKAAAEQDLREQ